MPKVRSSIFPPYLRMFSRRSPLEIISTATQQTSDNFKNSERIDAVDEVSPQYVDPSPAMLARLQFKGHVRALCLLWEGKVVAGDLGIPEDRLLGILQSIPGFRADMPTPQCYNVKLGDENILAVYGERGVEALIYHLRYEDTNSLVSEASACLEEFVRTGNISPAPVRVVAGDVQTRGSENGAPKPADLDGLRTALSIPFPKANEVKDDEISSAFATQDSFPSPYLNQEHEEPPAPTPAPKVETMPEPEPKGSGLAYHHLVEYLGHLLGKVATSGQIEGIIHRVTADMGLRADSFIPVDQCLDIGQKIFDKVPDRMKRKALVAELQAALNGLK